MMHSVKDQGQLGKGMNSRWSVLIFLSIAVAGLFYVKWSPYYHKVLVAAEQQSLGEPIIASADRAVPAPSWQAAYGYAVNYGKAVWQALLLGLLLGSAVQVLIPKAWLSRIFGRGRFSGTALAGFFSVPSMM